MCRNTLLFVCAIVFGGCFQTDKCISYAKKLCDKCTADTDNEEALCACVNKGKLTKDDAPDWFEDDEEAQEWCDLTLIEMRYADPYEKAECVQNLKVIAKFDDERTCEYFGWEEEDTGS
jgi:hypothetical protein